MVPRPKLGPFCPASNGFDLDGGTSALLQTPAPGPLAFASLLNCAGLASSLQIAWGKKVSPEFKAKAIDICKRLGVNPDYLMAAMAFETGETFSASKRSGDKPDGAVGLIQFTRVAAKSVSTSKGALADMSNVEQLTYVEKYLHRFRFKLKTLSDVYMAILCPVAVGKDEEYVCYSKDDPKHPEYYEQNKGLDKEKTGKITKEMAATRVHKELILGYQYKG